MYLAGETSRSASMFVGNSSFFVKSYGARISCSSRLWNKY